jgi:hypothetical protein
MPNTTLTSAPHRKPDNCKHGMFPLQVKLMVHLKAEAMASGDNGGDGGNQATHMPM